MKIVPTLIKSVLCLGLITSVYAQQHAPDENPAPSTESPERREEEVHATVARSQAERQKVGSETPQRDVASMPKAKDQAFQKEFDDLMEKDDDQAWFDQVDKLVEQ